jgi:outer membrane protein
MSALLPQAGISGGPTLNKYMQGATQGMPSVNATSRGYSMTLNLSQTVFNYTQFKALSGASAVSKEADATLNAAAQDLMVRLAQAYFTVLKDEDNLIYTKANQAAYYKQYDQINQQYHVGLKTITDVYTAKASYDSATATYITAQTTLANDQENLRVITGNLYPSMASLSKRFPLITPKPANIEEWVDTAKNQNWSIRAAQLAAQAARENVKQQFGGHVPTVSVQGAYNVAYNNNSTDVVAAGGSTLPTEQLSPTVAPTKAHTRDASVTLNLGIPLFQGGQVVAQTNQARYNYQVAQQQLEQSIRNTINTTRQSYLGVIAGIPQIEADRQAIKSSISSLEGLRAGYHVGTQTLVDVLNQQQKVFQSQTRYATDRYAYVISLLQLKQAAGTLSDADIQAINAWLVRGKASDDLEFEDESDKRYLDALADQPIRHQPVRVATAKKSQHVATAKLLHLPKPVLLAQSSQQKGDPTLSP